ncbi:hypothetical protein AM588_10011127 [Phytophthora nicotianae]|uniref:Uncharacterized protein n=1 Tax=Phytophthora nicotianae TaxID=4792 RepID=A0A0W8DRV5_PHYNI|nr:hypothetical protein AM588_10011127 [Phytophthora nicotianae]
MEGMLKKRVAKMPVMHDRYCVATWEMDAHDRKCVMLRSYKSRKAYDAHPEKPSSVHEIKCISDWDGKTGFHRYQHAFTMETRDKKLFQASRARTQGEKGKEREKEAKKKEKYTSPAERIHKKEERDAERAAEAAAAEAEAEVSNALVVVEKPVEQKPTQQALAVPEPAPTPAPKSTPASVQTDVVPTEQTAPAPATAPSPVTAPVAAPVSAPAPAPVSNGAVPAAQAMPMYQMVPPPFVPTYPVGPQSMPAYGLAATFGAYPPLYPAPYSYGGPWDRSLSSCARTWVSWPD